VGILKKRGSTLALMWSKRKFSLLVLLTLFLLMVPFASADLGSPVTDYNCRWAYASSLPTIDGTITGGEWANATVRDFTFDTRYTNGTSAKNVSARFLAKNDYANIYAAIQIFNIDFNQLDGMARWDAIALLLDDNHTHTLQSGDQGEEISTNLISPCYTYHDMYYDGSSWLTDNSASKTENGTLAWSHTNATQGAMGNYTVEMRIPLGGSDGDAYDLAITTLPKTIGYKIWFYEGDAGFNPTHGVYPDDSTINNNFLETTNASTFGNLILHPRYYLTIVTTTGGTTSPAPGVYDYGWGEVATVTALPSGGYAFDYWKLDGNTSYSNPINVTMYYNYTLTAYFKSAPPAVGGMAAPIIIQMNEPNLLSPLIWLASIIIPIALTIVFVKLKKKKL